MNPRISRALRNKRVRIALAIAVLLLVLREAGVVSLSLYHSGYHSAYSSGTSVQFVHENDAAIRPPIRSDSVRVSLPVRYAIQVDGDRAAARGLKSALQSDNAAPSAVPIRVTVNQMEITGPYWVPLQKLGKCRFSVDLGIDGSYPARYEKGIGGTIDMQVTGLCSAYQFRQILGKEVGSIIRRQVSRDVMSGSAPKRPAGGYQPALASPIPRGPSLQAQPGE